MNFKKIIAVIAAILCFGSASVNADKFDELYKNMEIAQQKYAQARENLKRVAGVLFEIFEDMKCIYVRHAAEIKIREKYPKEYSEYIDARMDLDDVRELLYVAQMNAVNATEEEK